MGQNRAGTAGEHPGEQVALPVDRAVAHGERATKHGLQVAGRRTLGYDVVTESKRAQLIAGNDTVLPSSHRRDRVMWASSAPFAVHGHIRRTGAGFAPWLGRAGEEEHAEAEGGIVEGAVGAFEIGGARSFLIERALGP